MSDAANALTQSITTITGRATQGIRRLQDARNRRRQLLLAQGNLNESAALDLDVRAQVDEVFLVFALLGEALIPLQVFDNAYYPQALDDVDTAILSGGHELMHTAFTALSAELQYVVTAALAFCSTFAPFPVYRGFGAAVLGDWDWGCPDMSTVMKKLMSKAGVLLKLKKDVDPQPNRPVLLAFDRLVGLLQVKQMPFLTHRPRNTGFAEQQPRYLPRPEKEVKDEISDLENWIKKIEKLGHPGPVGAKVNSWAIPYATWDSPFSCQMQKNRDGSETILRQQMDPGRLLHAFLCRNNLDLGERQLLVLLPGTAAESIVCWLEGLPGMTHKVVRWSDLDTTAFEEKCGKSVRRMIGKYPIPDRFAVRDNKIHIRRNVSGIDRVPSLPGATDSSTAPPPAYSDEGVLMTSAHSELGGQMVPAVELQTERVSRDICSKSVH
jgi:hypothetical protein